MYASQTTSPKPAAPAQTDPPGESPPRHAPRAVPLWAATLLMLLGGCGDGSESNQDDLARVAGSSRAATVFPAREGLVLVDYSAQGSELRQSMPTDHRGLASFELVADQIAVAERHAGDPDARVDRQSTERACRARGARRWTLGTL